MRQKLSVNLDTVKKWVFIITVISLQLQAQDTIRFADGKVSAVKVNEIGLTEIKYNRADNVTGPVYVVNKNEIKYIKYNNGSVDSFNVAKPQIESSQTETPAYVDYTPAEPSFQRIQIIGKKRLVYERHGLNDKALLSIIRKHPEKGIQNLMLREYSKISIYRNNRNIGLFMMYGGIATSLISVAIGSNGSVPAFLVGTAVGISGSIIATINKNKRYAKRRHIAKIYNGDNISSLEFNFR